MRNRTLLFRFKLSHPGHLDRQVVIKAKREIRVASLFKEAPDAFLRMIVVHELAHLKEREHDKAFYQLCLHMEPDYHQLEFDLRTYLSHLEATGQPLWAVAGVDTLGE